MKERFFRKRYLTRLGMLMGICSFILPAVESRAFLGSGEDSVVPYWSHSHWNGSEGEELLVIPVWLSGQVGDIELLYETGELDGSVQVTPLHQEEARVLQDVGGPALEAVLTWRLGTQNLTGAYGALGFILATGSKKGLDIEFNRSAGKTDSRSGEIKGNGMVIQVIAGFQGKGLSVGYTRFAGMGMFRTAKQGQGGMGVFVLPGLATSMKMSIYQEWQTMDRPDPETWVGAEGSLSSAHVLAPMFVSLGLFKRSEEFNAYEEGWRLNFGAGFGF
jgi:hypothetical protein